MTTHVNAPPFDTQHGVGYDTTDQTSGSIKARQTSHKTKPTPKNISYSDELVLAQPVSESYSLQATSHTIRTSSRTLERLSSKESGNSAPLQHRPSSMGTTSKIRKRSRLEVDDDIVASANASKKMKSAMFSHSLASPQPDSEHFRGKKL
jgi:hypothetical protein